MGRIEPREYELKTGEKLIVRSAAPDDAEALITHARLILAEDLFNVRTLEEFKLTLEKERELIGQHTERDGRIILVAELNGSVVGQLGFENHSRKRLAHHGMLHMNVGPEHRSKGIGRALLDSLLEWANENALIEKVTLEVFATNKAAIVLYRKLGFEEEGRKVRNVKIADGKYVDCLLMYKFVTGTSGSPARTELRH